MLEEIQESAHMSKTEGIMTRDVISEGSTGHMADAIQ
jgi:hypothetical protein